MAELPKIVQQRLKVSAPAGIHPDADLLTAFAEQALAPPERSRIMDHLARCGDCREIVALALPEEVEIAHGARVAARSAWFRWPALRWAAVAASVIAVASVGTLQYQRQRVRTASSYAKLEDKKVATAPPENSRLKEEVKKQPVAES